MPTQTLPRHLSISPSRPQEPALETHSTSRPQAATPTPAANPVLVLHPIVRSELLRPEIRCRSLQAHMTTVVLRRSLRTLELPENISPLPAPPEVLARFRTR